MSWIDEGGVGNMTGSGPGGNIGSSGSGTGTGSNGGSPAGGKAERFVKLRRHRANRKQSKPAPNGPPPSIPSVTSMNHFESVSRSPSHSQSQSQSISQSFATSEKSEKSEKSELRMERQASGDNNSNNENQNQTNGGNNNNNSDTGNSNNNSNTNENWHNGETGESNNIHKQQSNMIERRANKKVRRLLRYSTKYAAEQRNLKFFVLDCRSKEQYEAGHLPCAFHVNPDNDISSEQYREQLTTVLEMKGCHFVLFFDGRHSNIGELLVNTNDPLTIQTEEYNARHNINQSKINYDKNHLFRHSALLFFLEKRVKYISVCEAGYAGCHELIVGDLELIDHNSSQCIECNGKWKKSMLSSVKGRFNNLMQAAGGAAEKWKNKMIDSRMSSQNTIALYGNSSNQSSVQVSGRTSGQHNENIIVDGSITSNNNNNNSGKHDQTNNGSVLNENYNNTEDNYNSNNDLNFKPSMQKNIYGKKSYVGTGFSLKNMFEEKDIGYPNRLHLSKNEPLLMLYLSILRNKETKSDKFQDTTHKILLLIFNQILNHRLIDDNHGHHKMIKSGKKGSKKDVGFGLTFSRETLKSPYDVDFMSLIADRGMYGVALDDSSEHALERVLSSFRPIIRSVVGTLKVEESFTQDQNGVIRSNRQAVALMPRDIGNRIIVVFKAVICGNELHSVIDALLKLGANEKDIIVVCLIGTRISLLSIVERWHKLQIWIGCIDEHLENSRIRPGIGSFKLRYKYQKSEDEHRKSGRSGRSSRNNRSNRKRSKHRHHKHKQKNKSNEKEKEKEKETDKEKEKEKEKHKDKEKEAEKESQQNKSKNENENEKDRSGKKQDTEKDKEKEKEKDKETQNDVKSNLNSQQEV